MDLADLSTIKPAAEAFGSQEQKLDVLWNNGGIAACPAGSKTKQGHELVFGTNALGHFLLTKLLLPYLLAAAETAPKDSVRIVFFGSPPIDIQAPNGGLRVADISSPKNDISTNYAISKVGNWFLASEFAKRIKSSNGAVVSVCNNPGNLRTQIWTPLGWFIRQMMSITMHPPIYGAYTALWTGLGNEVTMDDAGRYAVPWGKWHPSPREDILASMKSKEEGGTGVAGEFWDWCEEQAKELC